MNSRKLLEIISQGESTRVEFKRKATTPVKLAKEISAIANTKGGYLIIGVDDDGKIYGIQSEKSESDIVEQACQFYIIPPIIPEIEIVPVANKDVLILSIVESEVKPHRAKLEENDNQSDSKVFIRLGEKSVEASKEMSRLMRHQTEDKPIKLSIGFNEKRLFNYLESNERATVKDFASLVNISDRRAERLLIRLVRAGVLSIHNDLYHDYFTLK